MPELKPRTSEVNARLWGARVRDWADLQKVLVRRLYETVLERAGVGAGTRYLDVGCGAGLAAEIAAARGATVTGIDASAPLLAIAREADASYRIRAVFRCLLAKP
jgi:2-polyprenyl-3-methyl-5-hydroxy-6-metoxy-1,4-benzoquinol methylase